MMAVVRGSNQTMTLLVYSTLGINIVYKTLRQEFEFLLNTLPFVLHYCQLCLVSWGDVISERNGKRISALSPYILLFCYPGSVSNPVGRPYGPVYRYVLCIVVKNTSRKRFD